MAAKVKQAIERGVARARAEGTAMRIGVTVEPTGVARIARPAVADRAPGDSAGADPIKAAEEPGSDLEIALARARMRGGARLAEILGGADMMRADEFARMIGATRETVAQKRRRHDVLGVEGPKRGVRFPDWQLTDDGALLPGLPDLFAEIGDRPWAVYRFLVMEHPVRGATGVAAMKHGRADDAVTLAGTIGRGAVT